MSGNADDMQFHDVNEVKDHIMQINVETMGPRPTPVAICAPSYEDEDGQISLMSVYQFYR